MLVGHPRPAGFGGCFIDIPIGQGSFRRAGRLQDLIPEGVASLMGIKVRVEEFGPDGTRDSDEDHVVFEDLSCRRYIPSKLGYGPSAGKDLLGIDAAQEFGIGRNEAREGRFYGSNGG